MRACHSRLSWDTFFVHARCVYDPMAHTARTSLGVRPRFKFQRSAWARGRLGRSSVFRPYPMRGPVASRRFVVPGPWDESVSGARRHFAVMLGSVRRRPRGSFFASPCSLSVCIGIGLDGMVYDTNRDLLRAWVQCRSQPPPFRPYVAYGRANPDARTLRSTWEPVGNPIVSRPAPAFVSRRCRPGPRRARWMAQDGHVRVATGACYATRAWAWGWDDALARAPRVAVADRRRTPAVCLGQNERVSPRGSERMCVRA